MYKDKNKIEQIIKKGEDYIAQHPEIKKMTLDEVSEHFEGIEYERGVNWSVIALLAADSLNTSNLEKLVIKLSSLEVMPLTKECLGYLLYSKYGINIENVLLLSDKIGVFDKILPYVGSNIIFQNEFQGDNILNIALLINKHLRENTAVHRLLLNYASHIINFNKETEVFDRLIDVDFEFKNDLLSKSSRNWFKKSKDTVIRRLEESFKSNSEEKIKTVLYIIRESYNQCEMTEHFYGRISRAGKSFSSVRTIIVSLYTRYLLGLEKENEIHIPILEELKIYAQDNQNKNNFLTAIQYEDKITEEIWDIFECIAAAPLPNEESFSVVDTIIYNHFKDQSVVLNLLSKIYSINNFNHDFDRFAEFFTLSLGILPNNDMSVWEYIWGEFDKRQSPYKFFSMGILLHKFNIDIKFTENVKQNNKSAFVNQICRVLTLLQYVSPIGDKVCKLYFDLAPLCSVEIEKYVAFGVDELYLSYPQTLSKISSECQNSDNGEIRMISNAIIEHDKKKCLEREKFYKIKDFRPSSTREKIFRKVLIEHTQRIQKQSEEKSIFLSLISKVHLKYGKRMGFITRFGDSSEYSSREPAAMMHEYEWPKKYLIDPVRYSINRINSLNEVAGDETDN